MNTRSIAAAILCLAVLASPALASGNPHHTGPVVTTPPAPNYPHRDPAPAPRPQQIPASNFVNPQTGERYNTGHGCHVEVTVAKGFYSVCN